MFYNNLNIKRTLETLNILERESEQNFTRVSPFAKKGDIFRHHIVPIPLFPLLHNKHISLYLSISNYISYHTQHEQLYILSLSMH